MPAILAIDTSTDACSVALSMGIETIGIQTIDTGITDTGIYERISHAAREHTQNLLPMIESLLTEHDIKLTDLDAIAFGSGPGSFTGLRIGLSVAQGLAYGADLPLVPVSSLKAMTHGAIRRYGLGQDAVIIPVIDARMDEIYWSAYTVNADSTEQLHQEQVCTPKQCAQVVNAQGFSGTVYGIGSGWHYSDLTALPIHEREEQFYPMAYDVAALAIAALAQGQRIDALKAQPQYLRNDIHWQKRKRIRR